MQSVPPAYRLYNNTVPRALDDAHRMRCTDYLKTTGLQLCLLLNFRKPRLEIKRAAHGL
jgi:hypothetical protein